MIGDSIEVTVVSIEGSQVRLGFNAPSNIAIHRKEIYQRIQDVNREAATTKETVQLPKLPRQE